MGTSDKSLDHWSKLGGAWTRETRDGDDIIRRTYTADPRQDPRARLDNAVRIFPNGDYQTTWYDADGVPTVDSVES